MSLSLEETKNSRAIAYLLEDNRPVKKIYYIDSDDLPEEQEALKKIRLNLSNESFFPLIKTFDDNEQNERVYICGESGCGKSYNMIRRYTELFKQKYPKSKVLLFSSKEKDKALDDLKYIERIKIDDDIVNNPLTIKEISAYSKPLLTIFDDIEDFSNKKINQAVQRLRDEVMRNGRSYGIFTLFTHHDPCDYKSTKSQIFESTAICTFPKQSGENAYDYLYEKKLHLNKKYINLINKTKSKFVYINKGNPKYIVADKYIILL